MRILQTLGALCASVIMTAALAGEATVHADRTMVMENESFNVTFTYSDEVRNEPAFEVLQEDFDVIAQNRRSNLASVNGSFTYELSWQLTLMPKRAGTLVIPPVAFDNDASPPLTITVKPAAGDSAAPLGDLSLEVELTPRVGYVQGQYIYTQRLYHRGWLAGGDLSEPDFGDMDAVVRQLDQVKRYSLFRGGERYQVYEQSYLVFPQRSGTLQTNDASFTGQLRPPGRAPLLKRVSAAGVSAQVKPVPAQFGGPTFLPAADLKLEEEWPEAATFEQGRPVTRVLRVTAQGLTAAQLPAFDIATIDGLRVYADQAKREDSFAQDGVTGVVEQSIALVPQVAGVMTLPAIELQWWDTVNDRLRRATLPSRQINVTAAAQTDAGVGATLAGNGAVSPQTVIAPGWWRPAAFAFAVLWLATLLGWWRHTRARTPPSGPPRNGGGSVSVFKARAAVKRACNAGDAAQAATALLAWAAAVWPATPPRSLRAIAARVDSELALEIDRLSQVRYGARAQWDEPQRLWRVLGKVRPARGDTKPATPDQDLAPL